MTDRAQPRISRRSAALLGVSAAAGLSVSALLRWLPKDGRRLEPSPVLAAALDDPGTPRFGPADADVTVVVFTDYRCGVCRATDPALGRLLARDGGVAVAIKDWPIRGEPARQAARIALAAHRQGRYLAVHQELMAAPPALEPAHLERAARAGGADWARLQADLAEHAEALDAQLARHATQAFGLGLRGTPGYLVGPFRHEGGLDERRLAAAVARARRA